MYMKKNSLGKYELASDGVETVGIHPDYIECSSLHLT